MSSPFRKLKLVSEDELLRLQERQLKQYDPNLRALTRTHSQMEDVLTSSSDQTMTPNERLRLLDMLRSRFRELKRASSTPTTTPLQPQPAAIEPVPEDEDEQEEEIGAPDEGEETESERLHESLKGNILSAIPTRSKTPALNLLDTILTKPSILSYNNRMEAVIGGKPIRGSNFISLYKTVFSTTPKRTQESQLTGYDAFHTALSTILAPLKQAYPSSHTRSLASTSSAAAAAISSPDSFSTPEQKPPGLAPSVLHAYKRDFD